MTFEQMVSAVRILHSATDASYRIEELAGPMGLVTRRKIMRALGLPWRSGRACGVRALRGAFYEAVPANPRAGCEAAVRADFAARCESLMAAAPLGLDEFGATWTARREQGIRV